MRKIKKISFAVGSFLALAVVFVAFTASSSAASLSSAIASKAVAEGIYQCAHGGAYASSFKASNVRGFVINPLSDTTVKLPYGQVSGPSNNDMNCEELTLGKILGFSGILPENVKKASDSHNDSDKATVAKFFAGDSLDGNGGVGYTATPINPQSSDGKTQQLTYKMPSLSTDVISQCGDGDLSKEVTLLKDGTKVNSIIFPRIQKNADGSVSVDKSDTSYNVPAPGSGGAATFSLCGDAIIIIDQGTDNQINYYLSPLNQTVMDYSGSPSEFSFNGVKLTPNVVEKKVENSGNFVSDYEIKVKDGVSSFGLNNKNATSYKVNNLTSYDQLALTRKEVYELYKYYITDRYIFNSQPICDDNSNFNTIKNSGNVKKINWMGGQECVIQTNNITETAPAGLYGVKADNHFGVLVTLDDVLAGLDKLGDLSDITGKKDPKKDDPKDDPKKDDPTNPDDPSNPDTPKEAETSDYEKCDDMMDKGLKSGEKIGSMQWILCPSMDNSVYAADWVDRMTDDWLSMDPTTYNADSVKVAWDAIRNISNILMIVFLLVIIFSQLTGYGIDNYGIKKMLPRLIVMAIVINMSWYICVMAADLSNIFGVSLRNLFAAIGNGLPAQLGSGDPDIAGTSYAAGAAVGMFAAAGSGGSAAVGAGITAASLGASAAVAIIIAVIVLALIILVAVMILFLMLGVRLIIVIICIILSPLAFASFVLPNTQNFFKKWWDAYKAALIIYPICGMLSGISHLLRNIFSEMGDVPIAVSAIAMIMPYLGFFLIPTLLKSAIAALGKFGGALTSMGNTIRNGGRAMGHAAAGAVKNSEGYKNMQNETARRRQQQSAERTIKKLEKMKEGGALNDAQTRRLARAHETIRKLGNEDQAARTILADKEYAGLALTSNDPNQRTLMGDWKEAWKKGDTAKMNALTDVIIARHGPGGANEIAGALAGEEIFDDSGNFVSKEAEASFNAIRINMQQNSAFAGAMQGKASDAYQMISGGGYYTDGNGVTKRGNLAAHSQYNSIATQAKDWATQSGATLKRAAAAGAFTQRQALELLNSTDPAVQSGIQTDASKRQVLEAVANGGHVDWNDKNSIQAASMNYQHGQALIENAEYDRRMAEQQLQAVNPPVHAPIDRPAPTANHMNNPSPRNSVEMNIDHHGDGADEIPE